MQADIKFKLNPSLYGRDPQESTLGKKILLHSVRMIDKMGFESFTFKKLATEIESTEASVYRYFKNKHLLLLFLTSWYWEWLHYLIRINIQHIPDSEKKMEIIIRKIVYATSENTKSDYLEEHLLHEIIINESSKSYHTKSVDVENKEGLFLSYKQLVDTISAVILEINPSFPYATSLSSNLFEMANNQLYFSDHLPRLTDLKSKKNKLKDLEKMLCSFVFKLLTK